MEVEEFVFSLHHQCLRSLARFSSLSFYIYFVNVFLRVGVEDFVPSLHHQCFAVSGALSEGTLCRKCQRNARVRSKKILDNFNVDIFFTYKIAFYYFFSGLIISRILFWIRVSLL